MNSGAYVGGEIPAIGDEIERARDPGNALAVGTVGRVKRLEGVSVKLDINSKYFCVNRFKLITRAEALYEGGQYPGIGDRVERVRGCHLKEQGIVTETAAVSHEETIQESYVKLKGSNGTWSTNSFKLIARAEALYEGGEMPEVGDTVKLTEGKNRVCFELLEDIVVRATCKQGLYFKGLYNCYGTSLFKLVSRLHSPSEKVAQEQQDIKDFEKANGSEHLEGLDTKPEAGEKFDNNKPRYNLLNWKHVEDIACVLTIGAQKYAPGNWKHVPNARDRYFSAIHRHMSAYHGGEKLDPETGVSHLAHIACNLGFLDWFDREEENGWVNRKESPKRCNVFFTESTPETRDKNITEMYENLQRVVNLKKADIDGTDFQIISLKELQERVQKATDKERTERWIAMGERLVAATKAALEKAGVLEWQPQRDGSIESRPLSKDSGYYKIGAGDKDGTHKVETPELRTYTCPDVEKAKRLCEQEVQFLSRAEAYREERKTLLVPTKEPDPKA